MRWIWLFLLLLCGGLAWLYFTPASVDVREVSEEEASAPAPAPGPEPGLPDSLPPPPGTNSRVPAPPLFTPPEGTEASATATGTFTSTSQFTSAANSTGSATSAPPRSPDEQAALLTLKDDHGNPRLMTREEAIKACDGLGGYVASMRQWAEHGGRRGAFGILEVKEVVTGNVEPPLSYSVDGTEEMTYYLVRAVDADGKKDQFYYNPRGYRPSSHAHGRLLFHTSSVDVSGRAFAYGINGANGVLGGQVAPGGASGATGANGDGAQLAYATCWKREK